MYCRWYCFLAKHFGSLPLQGRSCSKYLQNSYLLWVRNQFQCQFSIFTACQTKTTGFIFFCKIIPASCNLSSFLHSIFMKVFFSLDPEYRKLFQDLHCQVGALYVYDFYHIIFLSNYVLTQKQAGKLGVSRRLSDNQGNVIFSSKNTRSMSCVIEPAVSA